ncbi:hypothetical protein R5R35_007925 [Gryllus longicercus]|uniref:Uncharacterized protein n=1 Tax=Gryllus longicercus TaxID=2509291 RepID=A0AAN9Z795_9ORTH
MSVDVTHEPSIEVAQCALNPGYTVDETNANAWFTAASVPGTFAANIHDPLFGPTEVTPTIATGLNRNVVCCWVYRQANVGNSKG